MEEYMLCDLHWVYDLQKRNLSVYVVNSTKTKVKNLVNGSIYDIPKYHGDYGSEYRLDFDRILNSSCLTYTFKDLYRMVGTKAFVTLKDEQKNVDAETKKMQKNAYDYNPQDWPEVSPYQYMSRENIVAATQKAQPILQQNEDVKRRERQVENKNNLDF